MNNRENRIIRLSALTLVGLISLLFIAGLGLKTRSAKAANALTTSGNSATPTRGQWVQTNGPYGGDIRALLVNGTNLFAGTNGGGVFLSTNNGQSWA
ncbi:MAG: hypothetical protein M3X11_13785, partial [Acidobacteriota bacterium]|nr:hypothetical protein [Acidobacteriota bacterium]